MLSRRGLNCHRWERSPGLLLGHGGQQAPGDFAASSSGMALAEVPSGHKDCKGLAEPDVASSWRLSPLLSRVAESSWY